MAKVNESTKMRYLAGRVKKACRILDMFYDSGDMQTSAADCLADMMHLATREDWSFWDALERARKHHWAEQSGGEHG